MLDDNVYTLLQTVEYKMTVMPGGVVCWVDSVVMAVVPCLGLFSVSRDAVLLYFLVGRVFLGASTSRSRAGCAIAASRTQDAASPAASTQCVCMYMCVWQVKHARADYF